MGNLGMGVMLGILGGNGETVEAIKSSLNKTIENVFLDNDTLTLHFTDGTTLLISDEGQACCEDRYMTTDDNLSDFKGATLLDLELKSVEVIDEGYNYHEIQFLDVKYHEIQFLDVKTTKGVFTMVNHNEHNGFYGGFWVVGRIA